MQRFDELEGFKGCHFEPQYFLAKNYHPRPQVKHTRKRDLNDLDPKKNWSRKAHRRKPH